MTKTADVSKHHFSEYLQKAEENFQSLKEAIQAARWNAASLIAIHCMISSADALTVYYLEKRSISERHQDAANLIQRLPISGTTEKVKQFLDVINLKNKVEYEHDLTSENQAQQIAKQTERFYSWAKSQLPKTP